MRVVSEITESNGSSSMASVCGGCLSLMDAGVPMKAHVAGIAMGLIKDGNRFAVLTDILGDEDHLGDMDFKVAGTTNGITALQMDIKIQGITKEIMQVALAQAKEARMHILGKMQEAMGEAKPEQLVVGVDGCVCVCVCVCVCFVFFFFFFGGRVRSMKPLISDALKYKGC